MLHGGPKAPCQALGGRRDPVARCVGSDSSSSALVKRHAALCQTGGMIRMSNRTQLLAAASFLSVMGIGTLGCSPRFKCPQAPSPDPRAAAIVAGGRGGSSSTIQADPQDALVAVDPACSTYCFEQDGEGWQAPVFGTVGLTIDPECMGPTCTLTISKLQLTTGDLRIDGHTVSSVEIWNLRNTMGIWGSDGAFVLPSLSTYIYTGFMLDGAPFGQGFTNLPEVLSGTLDPDYQQFTLTGGMARGDWAAVSFHLCGHPVGRPPVAVVTPSGTIPTDAPGVAHVTFSSAQSHDPDDDIQHIEWRVDGESSPMVDTDTLRVVLSVGAHQVSLKLTDRRGVRRNASTMVNVIEAMGSTGAM